MPRNRRKSWARRVGPAVFILGLIAAVAAAGEDRFTFAVLGDRTGGARAGVYESVVAEVSFFDPDFIITVGDHIEGYAFDKQETEQQWDEFKEIMESSGIKYYLTPGNHDIWDDQSEEIYRDRVGDLNKAFKVDNTRFIIFDVSRNSGIDDFTEEQVKWLTKELEKSEDAAHTLVFLHKPFWCEDFSFGRESRLHALFLEHGVTAVFSGHYHRYFYTERDGIRYYCVGSSGGSMWSSEREGSFYCYLLCQVAGDSLRVELMEPDSFRPVDSVTMEGVMDLTSFKNESVELSEIRVEGTSLTGTARVSITVTNSSEKTLGDTARWDLREGWTVEPETDYIEVPPGEVGQLTAIVSADGLVFPVPRLRISLPYRDEEPFEIVEYLNVRRTEQATRVGEAPAIDGLIEDGVWRSATPETEYFGWRGGETEGDPTSLWVGYDSENLYLAARCSDAEPESIRAVVKERDGFAGHDDHVGILVQPDRGAEVFYQILVNSNGAVFDRKIEINPYGSYVMLPGWDGSVEAAARVTEDGWTVEFAVPLADLGQAGPGSEWGFNFQRYHVREETVSNFQAPLSFSSSTMGILQFE
jgi:predicted phosphodiesterase